MTNQRNKSTQVQLGEAVCLTGVTWHVDVPTITKPTSFSPSPNSVSFQDLVIPPSSHEGMLLGPIFYVGGHSCSDFNTAMPCSKDKVPQHGRRGVMSRDAFHQGHPRAFHLKVSFRLLRCYFPLRAPSSLFGPPRPAKRGDASTKGWRLQKDALLCGWSNERRWLLLTSAFQRFSERHRIQATENRQNISAQSTEPEGVH